MVDPKNDPSQQCLGGPLHHFLHVVVGDLGGLAGAVNRVNHDCGSKKMCDLYIYITYYILYILHVYLYIYYHYFIIIIIYLHVYMYASIYTYSGIHLSPNSADHRDGTFSRLRMMVRSPRMTASRTPRDDCHDNDNKNEKDNNDNGNDISNDIVYIYIIMIMMMMTMMMMILDRYDIFVYIYILYYIIYIYMY